MLRAVKMWVSLTLLAVITLAVGVLGGCRAPKQAPAVEQDAATTPPAPTFAPLDGARRALLAVETNRVIDLLWRGQCDAWMSAVQVPFGYGRRDVQFQRVGMTALSPGQAKIYCTDLAALKQPRLILILEDATHLAPGQWDVQEMKALMPHGTDRLTFGIDGKPDEGLELYFDANGRCVALIEVMRPMQPKPPKAPAPTSPPATPPPQPPAPTSPPATPPTQQPPSPTSP
jgi:hypothetical protein